MTDLHAWLIELPSTSTLYWCGPSDWCSNPNHAHKFDTEQEALEVMNEMCVMIDGQPRVCGHSWVSA
jgi:hypothetical protein